jgi:mono/diheme cytochrome c family protein
MSLATFASLAGLAAACTGGGDTDTAAGTEGFAEILATVEIPDDLASGRTLFDANCLVCHGPAALGTRQGPPLVHPVYEPAHHADAAFTLAVRRGVRAHHWRFGDMPSLPHVTPEQTGEITRYVRFLQRRVGIE